jgi:hypothetical protein
MSVEEFLDHLDLSTKHPLSPETNEERERERKGKEKESIPNEIGKGKTKEHRETERNREKQRGGEENLLMGVESSAAVDNDCIHQ